MKADREGKARIGEAIEMFHSALNVYGKTPEQLESVTKLFMFALSDYPVFKIREAMAYYVKNYANFPAPSDIVQIIERGNKPPFEKSIYVNICRKDASERSSQEWEYIREYESFMING